MRVLAGDGSERGLTSEIPVSLRHRGIPLETTIWKSDVLGGIRCVYSQAKS
jgi:hypothetical protein